MALGFAHHSQKTCRSCLGSRGLAKEDGVTQANEACGNTL